MKTVCLVILGVVLMSGCATSRQPMVSASDWFNGGHDVERSGTCVDPNQR